MTDEAKPTRMVTITIESDIDIPIEDIWVDGDVESVTATDIKAMMQSEGYNRVMRDWDLVNDMNISVIVDRDTEHVFLGGRDA